MKRVKKTEARRAQPTRKESLKETGVMTGPYLSYFLFFLVSFSSARLHFTIMESRTLKIATGFKSRGKKDELRSKTRQTLGVWGMGYIPWHGDIHISRLSSTTTTTSASASNMC